MLRLGCKAIGIALFMFCIGMLCGLLFPVYIVAIVETILILIIAYYCLFKF